MLNDGFHHAVSVSLQPLELLNIEPLLPTHHLEVFDRKSCKITLAGQLPHHDNGCRTW